MIFQIVFAALTLLGMFYFLVATRSTALQRLFLILFFSTGIFFILQPELSNRLAQRVGIGRGADLISYLSLFFLFLVCINFYFRFRAYEEGLTDLVRKIAVLSPVHEDELKSPDVSSTSINDGKNN